MDFNFAACYIKQKPKSKLINIIIPVAIIGSLGGLMVYVGADFYELSSLKASMLEMQDVMATQTFQTQYAKANEVSAQINLIQTGVQSLRVMDHIFTEKKLQSPVFWEMLIGGMPEGSYFASATILQDGVVTVTGSSNSVDDVALMEEQLRNSPNVTYILVQSYIEQDGRVSFNMVLHYSAITPDERVAAKEALNN